MKKIIALTALGLMLAFSCFACGSPRGSGNGSIQASAAKAKATAATTVATVDLKISTTDIDVARQARAVEAVSSAERAELGAPTVASYAPVSMDPGALHYRQEPFDRTDALAKVRKLPNCTAYTGLGGDHYARADV